MNKHFLLGLFLIIISLASCSKREIELDEADPTMIKAITEKLIEASATSKSEKEVLWNPGDEIAVFSGELSGKFESTLKKKPSSAAVFRGDLGLEAWPEEMDIWAVYPYSEEAFFDGETITTVLPSEQIARDGEFGKDMNLAIAHSNTSILQFYNVGGGIRFSVTEEGIKKVMFEGLGGEIISGKVKIGFDDDGLPEIRKVVSGSQFITILPPDGQETFQRDTWYYIVVIPGSLDRGYKLRFYKDSDYARKVSDNTLKIKRSFYRDMEKVDEEIEYEAQTTHFPKTEEEWEESFELTDRIIKAYSVIEDTKDRIEVDEAIIILEHIDGVLSVVPNPDSTAVSVMQKDSTWVTIALFNPIIPIQETNDVDYFVSSQDKALLKTDYIKQRGRALILSPFQWQFNYPVDDWYKELDKDFAVDSLLNSHADIHWFKGVNLDNYDLVLILTHGHSSVFKSSFTTALCTGTVYHKGLVTELINNGFLDSNEYLTKLKPQGTNNYYLSILPSFIEDANFNKTAVILAACESAKKTGVFFRKRKMIEAFLDRGASFVSGNDTEIFNGAMMRYVGALLRVLSQGMSFIDAHWYATKSKEAKLWCDRVIKADKDFYKDNKGLKGWDIFNHTLCFPEDSEDDFYVRNPFPVLDIPKDGENSLKWTNTLSPFKTQWIDLSFKYGDDGEVEAVYHNNEYNYNIVYDVFVDGGYIGQTTKKNFDCSSIPSGPHNAYVIGSVVAEEDSRVLYSYQSNVVDFTATGQNVAITSISLDKSSIELNVGNSVILEATILPSNATNKNVTWSSSNPSVATVSSTGEVKGVAKGSSVITVRTEDGGKTATCRVTVTETKISVSGVSLNKASLSMAVGDTQTLTATVTPSNATDKSVTWSSSNTSVATVSSSGVVSAKKAGTATITVKTNDGGKKATCSVTVKDTSMGGDIEGTGENQWN